ncbi:hypothetical protein [Snodgrassella sp. W8124]|nr:hypothetical protein [Snodgrassella sp. W8124]
MTYLLFVFTILQQVTDMVDKGVKCLGHDFQPELIISNAREG